MMLQLVQSPSKRVQRLIKTNCASDGESIDMTAPTSKANGDKKKRVPQQGQKSDNEEDNDDADDDNGRNQDDSESPLTRGARSSSSVVSSSKSSEGDGPIVTRVDKFTNRGGSLIAASASSYTSKRAHTDNEDLDDDVDGSPEDDDRQ